MILLNIYQIYIYIGGIVIIGGFGAFLMPLKAPCEGINTRQIQKENSDYSNSNNNNSNNNNIIIIIIINCSCYL